MTRADKGRVFAPILARHASLGCIPKEKPKTLQKQQRLLFSAFPNIGDFVSTIQLICRSFIKIIREDTS